MTGLAVGHHADLFQHLIKNNLALIDKRVWNDREVFMGTVIVSVALFVIVTLIVKSLCKKYIKARKTGTCCCGCSGCCGGKCNK